MKEQKSVVPFEEAFHQIQTAYASLALLHLSFSKVLVDFVGEEEGKDLIIRSIMKYGQLKKKYSELANLATPFYGIHGKYIYKGEELYDTRDFFHKEGDLDLSSLEIHDCSLAKVFGILNEEKLGKLYCYVDASVSMASDPSSKTIHIKNVLCGDNHCQLNVEKTSEQERRSYKDSDKDWKKVDSILL